MTTPASPTPVTPAVSTAPQSKGQRHRIITPTMPYIDSSKPVVNLRGSKAPMTFAPSSQVKFS